MKNSQKQPKLRFPEFKNDWVQSNLSSFSVINPKALELPDEFIYIDLESVEKGQLNKRQCMSRYDAPSRAQRLLTKGDILYQTVRPYQRNNYYFDSDDKDYVASTGYAQIRATNSPRFLFQYLHTNFFVNKVLLSCTGTSYPAINSSDLGKIKVCYPSSSEQQKIAAFLTAVDDKIRKLSKKKALLEEYKKGVMQQIFNQEIRFKDENDDEFPDWQMTKLGDVSDVRDGTHDSPKYVDEGYPLITSKNLLSNGSIDLANVNLISTADYVSVNKRSNVSTGDVLFGMIGTIGNPVLVVNSDFAIKNVALIREQELLSNKFLVQFLKGHLIIRQFHEQNTGGTQKFLSLGVIRNLVISLPCLDEQAKIANFLSALDDKIKHVDQQIELTKQYKKGLLQQMFV